MEVDLISAMSILQIFPFMLIPLVIFIIVQSLNKRKEKLQQEILRDNLREISVVNNVNDFLTYDKETILNSPEFKRVHDNYKPSDYPAIVGLLKEFVRPYKPFEYYKIHNNIRNLNGADKINTSNCYRQSITASAIIFNLTIPRMLSTSDLSVLTYCSFYLKLTELVNYDEQMQQYIKNEYHNTNTDLVTKSHKDLKIHIQCLESLNALVSDMHINYRHYFTIELLYIEWSKWLAKHNYKDVYVDYYNADISNFKELATLYYGVMQMNMPLSYYHFTPAIVDYILQSKRYSNAKLTLVASNDESMV